jgi:hypothetical protein
MASKIEIKKWENIDATITPRMMVKMKFTQSTPDIKITATKPWRSDHKLYKWSMRLCGDWVNSATTLTSSTNATSELGAA